jgi:TonB family protein
MVPNETNLQVDAAAAKAGPEEKQRRRMLVALGLLLVALIVVLIKDRQFWFQSSPPSEPTMAEQTTAPVTSSPTSQSTVSSTLVPPAQPAAPLESHKKKANKIRANRPEVKAHGQPDNSQAAEGPVITATNRMVLPPLEVEVVAGNHRSALSPKNNSVKVDMDGGSSAPPPPEAAQEPVADASAQVSLPQATAERVSRSVKPDYPLLAKQMKVQGAVVLQALIDKAGRIEELHVVTGPAILATAAEEAVKQWRFKPYYQQGQAVETEARITVNFTISTY